MLVVIVFWCRCSLAFYVYASIGPVPEACPTSFFVVAPPGPKSTHHSQLRILAGWVCSEAASYDKYLWLCLHTESVLY